jgi:hypothetical protein
MSVAPFAGVVALDNFKSPTASEDGLQGQVPKPLAGQQTYILSASGWVTAGGGGGTGTVTSVAATVPAFLSVSGSPITTSGTLAISYSGTALPVANGGTGVTASSGANSVVLRDANQNVTANAFDDAYINTAASGTQITLTVASARRYTITGSGGQVIKLPDATTLTNGVVFQFDNNQSSGAITVNNNSNTLVASVPSGGFVLVNLLSNASAAGSWDRHDQAPSNVSWSTNTFDYPGSITSATWNGTVIAYNRGGTGQSAAFVAGGIVYGSTTSALAVTPIGTSGQVLTSAGAGIPVWSTPTTGTVTSVSGTGTVSGISLSGTVTSSGNLTLGGTLDLSSPPAIGGTAASTGRFTTITSTVATGTAPFAVASTTPVTNLSIGGNAGTVTNGVYTTDTGTVTNTMLAGSITNNKLNNSSITFGVTSQALGSTVSAISGVTIDNGVIGGTAAAAGTFTTVTATTVNIAASAANAGLTLLRDTGTATRSSRIFLDASSGVCAIYNNANSILFNTSATIGSSSGTNQFLVFHTASAVDYVQVTGGTTVTKTVTVSAQGSDTDVDLALVPKGAGRVTVSTSIKPKVNSAANVTSPLAWNSTSYDEYAITALANALTINADANASPADGQRMMFRFKDNGTARALTWTTGSTNSFRVVGVTLPTTTVASKLVYIGCIYNAADSRWDAVAVSQEA